MTDEKRSSEWGEIRPEAILNELADTLLELVDITVSAPAPTRERLMPLVEKQVETLRKLTQEIRKYNHFTAKVLETSINQERDRGLLDRELETVRQKLERLRVARTNIGFRGPNRP